MAGSDCPTGRPPGIGATGRDRVAGHLLASYGGLWPIALLMAVAAIGWFGSRPLRRTVEQGFWSLNSIAVQPAYALFREGVRHLLESLLENRLDAVRGRRLRAASAAAAGVILSLLALLAAWSAWPLSRWNGQVADLIAPLGLVTPTLANAVIILCGYCAGAAIVWGLADAMMDQPQDLPAFGDPILVMEMAYRTSVRHPCCWRTLRLSNRKRPIRTTRQRATGRASGEA